MAVEICIDAVATFAAHSADGLLRLPVAMARPSSARVAEPPATLDGLTEALDDLPYDEAMAIWLVDVCGDDYATVGETTGRSHRSVARTIRSGRRRLRRAIS